MGLTVEKCLQAWTNSLRQMNAKADIVFFGDSLTYYGNFASVFPDKVVCNLGLRGDTIQGMIDRVEQVKMLEPKQVFLMAGINDVASSTIEEFENNYDKLVNRIRELLPQSEIILQSILPVNSSGFIISCNNNQISECNVVIDKISQKQCFRFLDVYSLYEKNGEMPKEETIDGIHLLPPSYNKWKKALSMLRNLTCLS